MPTPAALSPLALLPASRARLAALLALGLLACGDGKPVNDGALEGSGLEGFADADSDSFPADEDCNDTEASVHPGAVELCDGMDNDCDGLIDEDVSDTWYPDVDGDGFGDPTAGVEACEAPPGTVAAGTDCDDADAAVHPAASDPCDDVDNDCDGIVDDGLRDTYYADRDGDGHGDAAAPVEACAPEDGLVATADDCDDAEAAAHPGAEEVCDAIDNDCDGETDEGLGDLWYADADGDGWGHDPSAEETCDPPLGAVLVGGDCDDGNASVRPDAAELCNLTDDDCDGLIDDSDDSLDLSTADAYYADRDADSYGDPDADTLACAPPPGHVTDATDCRDTDAAIHPGAVEVCDGQDNECDALIDDADPSLDLGTADDWYRDLDADTYGGDTAVTTCAPPAGFVDNSDDCDDADPAEYPGAAERWYDGVDSDCDGELEPDPCEGLPGDSTVAVDSSCEAVYPPAGGWDVTLEWQSADRPYSVGPSYTRVMMTPVVGQLTDDDLDGAITDNDVPDIAFTTFSGGAYNSAGYLRVLAGDGSSEVLSVGTVVDPRDRRSRGIRGTAGVAVGDIDADGYPDIVTITDSLELVALEADGRTKWISTQTLGSGAGAPALHDLDGDGTAEIIAGAHVFEHTGALRSSMASAGVSLGYAADLDMDDLPEVIVGNRAYEASGALSWTAGGISDGTTAVADFNGDGDPEIIVHTSNYMTLLDGDGRVLWQTYVADAGAGAPCIADFDGDGLPEVAAAGRGRITMLEHTGAIKWWNTTQDNSSSVTGCSAFDFDADGAAELVYADEIDLYLYDGPTGAVQWTQPDHASGTLYEYPVIADVDGDGNAEIIVPNNNYAFVGADGITVYGERNDGWANARKTWNQFAYSVDNINDDLSVPALEGRSWETHNTFRCQQPWDGPAAAAPNLAPHVVGICEDCAAGGFALYVSVENTGLIFAPAGVEVALYAQSGASRTLLRTAVTTGAIDPGVRAAPLELAVDWAEVGTDGLWIAVDDNGVGLSTLRECDEADNSAAWDEASACP